VIPDACQGAEISVPHSTCGLAEIAKDAPRRSKNAATALKREKARA
jgi:hypothetical protein